MSQSLELLRRLLRAKDRMDGASHEQWPIDRLAQVSAVSAAHFARSFGRAFGVPPHRYLLTRRIECAMALLRDSGLPVTEIAFQTGCKSLGTFGRILREVTGDNQGALRARERRLRDEGKHMPECRPECRPECMPECMPECIVRAAHRPDLKTAVLEKRRGMAVGKTEPLTTELPWPKV